MPVFVNNIEITDDQVHEEMQHHPAASVDDARHEAAQALIVDELLRQQALTEGYLEPTLSKSDQAKEAAVAKLLEEHVAAKPADDEICARYYDNNKSKYFDDTSGDTLPLKMVIEHIREYLQTSSIRNELRQYILGLYREAKIVGFELKLEENSFH